MSEYSSRFPGKSNDPGQHVLTEREAGRLSALSALTAAELTGKPFSAVADKLRDIIGGESLLFRRICGCVVKTDTDGHALPVPFATVTVYDTDFSLVAWSPPGSIFSWFWPWRIRREVLARVTTDECGRFCVWVPRFDIDYYLSWRLARHCYLTWLRKPTIADLLRVREVIPQPDPGPIRIDDQVLIHAARVLEAPAVAHLRELAGNLKPGALQVEADTAWARPAFPQPVRPPLPAETLKAIDGGLLAQVAARAGAPLAATDKFDVHHPHGPFIRCELVPVPQWTAVLDIPDLTFGVTQDVDGDGQQEVIYSESLFDVRWNAGNLGCVVLHADPIAVTNPSCCLPAVPDGSTAILFAGNYPLQVPGNASAFHDAATGYALLPNRPDKNGSPNEGERVEPAQSPFTGSFYLVGSASRAEASHYRVHHQVDGGPTTYLNGAFGPLVKLVGGVLQQLVVSPVDGQWYPIIPSSAGWSPAGILAPVREGGNHQHAFRLEFGKLENGTVVKLANSLTPTVHVRIDAAAPAVDFLALHWRHPELSLGWSNLPRAGCPVVVRNAGRRVQLHLRVSISANHLRDFAVNAYGCGAASAPQLVTDGRDGLPVAAADAAAHWHTGAADNSATRDLYYELPAGAPAGCYHFSVWAASRAFRPTEVVSDRNPDPAVAWRYDTAPIYVIPMLAFAVQ